MIAAHSVQHSHLDYDRKGGIIGMNLEGLASPFAWKYDETSGFLNHLTYLHTGNYLTMPPSSCCDQA